MIYLNQVSGDRNDKGDMIVRVTPEEFRVMAMLFEPASNELATPGLVRAIRSVSIARKMLLDSLAALDAPDVG